MTATPTNQPLNLVIVGHVDHGKSTLVGRLLFDTDSLPKGKIEAIQAMSEKRGMPLEYAFLLDALQAERDQGITIDTTQIHFKTDKRTYVIIDAPGHKEFLKNMVSGAALADAAIMVIDAKEGVQEQSRRHGYLLHLLGLTQVAVAINKMDLVQYDQTRFDEVANEVRTYLAEIGVDTTAVIPLSAREGAGMQGPAKEMPWYQGPSLVQVLDAFSPPMLSTDLPLRLPVQDVYKFDERRIIVGRVESGTLRVGDELLFSPSNKTARVATIESWGTPGPLTIVSAGQSAGFTLEEQLFLERGHVAGPVDNPPMETNIFRARLFWLGHTPLEVGKRYLMKLTTAEYSIEVQSVETVIDVEDLSRTSSDKILRNGVGEVILRARATITVDEFTANPRTGRFVLIQDYDTVGGGIISMDGFPDQRERYSVTSQNIVAVEHGVDAPARARSNGHESGILWLTGLSGAGKSTLAIELEQQLFRKGYQVYVLDGDNIRFGLSADLGFSPDDRAENIRRVGEVAKLFADAGFLVVTAFISPYREDRNRARAIAPEVFHEVHVKADLSVCEGRDPKGLYAKARRGEIPEFTGISAPYEEPERPELTVDTGQLNIQESILRLVDYVSENFSGHNDDG